MSLKLEQFIKFTTDSVGLERTFRLFQAIVQILSYFTIPFDLLLFTLNTTTGQIPSSSAVRIILKALNQRLGLARRFFRLFRFLESFNAAQKLSAKLSSPETWTGEHRGLLVKAEPWLDVFARTFNGLYLLLEASTVVDALAIPGLSILGPELERTVAVEAQRFWLFSLVCGLAYNLLEIPLAVAVSMPPAQALPAADEKDADERLASGHMTADEHAEFLGRIGKEREEKARAWALQVAASIRRLSRAAAANAIDILLPGTVVGWIKAEPGTVGLAMFATTILTGMEVWERCGREVAGVKAPYSGSYAIPRRP
ncbi:peroxisomal biogenesis factor 11 [Jackrogersella minutella]|nr:peroxisomal biogenesis factor 11 [Jackrogersella minutella]